ncbi:MAG TPA: hypothetical protein VFV87_22675 [Pirellulaceae bacterium]|nr:hypothetical protein [Pirellulaceae bacterium]
MLRKSLVGLLVLTAVVLACSSSLLAQGKGKGLSKALSKAGTSGGASAGLNRAGQNASRVGGSLNRANGLGRSGALGGNALGGNAVGGPAPSGKGFGSARGLQKPPAETSTMAGADAATRHQRQLLIEQTNRDRRIAQAQHLREIAARNGDAELAANADRLEAYANDHYLDRVGHQSRFGVTDPDLPPNPLPGDPPAPPSDPLAQPGDPTTGQPTP